MPTSTTAGTASAGSARTVTPIRCASGSEGSRGKLRRRASYQTQAKNAAACSNPGRMPARNSRGTDCSATIPYRISARLGGMTIPMVPDAPMTPKANDRGYPFSIIAGSRIVPIASAVATDDPQIAANSVQATTVTSPSEPRTPPSHAADTSTSAFATPPWRMNAAAITNSGSDISAGEFSWSMITCARPIIGSPETAYRTAVHAPSTRKIGIPADSRPKNISRNRNGPTAHRSRGGPGRSGKSCWGIACPADIVFGSKRNR